MLRRPLPLPLPILLLVLLTPAGCGAPDTQTRELARFSVVYDRYVDPQAAPAQRRGQMDIFRTALKRVSDLYVAPSDSKLLIDAAIKGVEEMKPKPASVPPNELVEKALGTMLSSLDPHSNFLTPEQYKDLSSSTRGEFGGLGIEIAMENEEVKVVSPIDGTPAARAGLKTGDIITHIEGEPIKGQSLSQIVRKLRGKPDTVVRITLRRDAGSSFQVAITRAIIVVKPVRWHLESNVGYLRLTTFNEHADEELRLAVAEIQKQGGSQIKGYILDLRNNAGGLLDQAVKISDDFLNDGEVVSVRGRKSGEEHYKARAGDVTGGRPLAVLINPGSASASEIVAGALQDHKRAVLLGTTSFGKGSVQTILPLDHGAALKLTTALYYTPAGRSIQARGIEPDLIIAGDPAEVKREADLAQALPALEAKGPRAIAQFSENICPPAQDPKDKLLGCAVSLLEAGGLQQFIALRNAQAAAHPPPAAQ
ncbi:MAG: S41 family peptidase [Rhodospirillales bacterium]|jgi:carboxyl-terminal processing protease|nr:S41 family peptidase [Rhodospirillales bacterium]